MEGKNRNFTHNFYTQKLTPGDIPKERFMGDAYCEGRHADCLRCSMFKVSRDLLSNLKSEGRQLEQCVFFSF